VVAKVVKAEAAARAIIAIVCFKFEFARFSSDGLRAATGHCPAVVRRPPLNVLESIPPNPIKTRDCLAPFPLPAVAQLAIPFPADAERAERIEFHASVMRR